MALIIIEIIIILSLPLLFKYLSTKAKILKTLGPIILCYAFGILIGNIGLPWDRGLSTTISEITVPLAIPLILFSLDLRKWFSLAKKTVLSFVLMIIAAMAASIIAALIFSGQLEEGWKISGMLTGCYTGGTPNLMAIGMGLDVQARTLIMVNACDIMIGGIYFFLMITVVKWGLRKILPPFQSTGNTHEEDVNALKGIFSVGKRKGTKGLLFAGVLALASVALSIGIALLITGKMDVAIIILVVTTCGIALSFWKKVRATHGTWNMGQYVILVFSFALGSSVDINLFFNATPMLLGYTATVMFGALFIHLILSCIFKIDADTTLITSTAGIYGPAFIGPVAEALGNREVLMSGLVSGLVGYAIGNYVGLAIAYLIKLIT
ncbi:MAG: DUF819 family protein [Clostridiales bacterium]|nr:DUF819 family protein [Clostridiales bacterium]